jgi:cyclophilin family peptidyl-prolyl cis-trans isomerase/predicted DsbA family dithiol-disulfide isomerase
MRKHTIGFLSALLLLGVLAACQTAASIETAMPPTATSVPPTATWTTAPTETPVPTPAATATPATADVPAATPSGPGPARAGPTPTPEWQIPRVGEADWGEGNPDAKLVVVEYSDFQCPYCSGAAEFLTGLVERFPDEMYVVFRHFPLTSIHDKAVIAAEAAEAAGVQGQFWGMHDLLFERQAEWSGRAVGEMPGVLAGYAEELGLDVAQFSRALEDGTYRERVEGAFEEARGLGIGGTPTLFINGQLYNGAREEFFFVGLIKLFNYDGPLYAAAPPMTIDPERAYFATFETSKGTFCAELYADRAPQTVNSFVFLANEGYYDGVPFHRVLPGFVAQTGDPTGSGFGGPGYRFDDEIDPQLKHDGPGILSMANGGPNTNGSQFFITYTALPDLDGKHTVFGRVVEGLSVAESLPARDPQQDPYAPADTLISVKITESCPG